MKRLWSAAVALLCLAPHVPAEEIGKAYQVPYRMTSFQHVVVRAKINGKGPFNFILDTGAPALFISKDVGKKLGLKVDKGNWTALDRFEIEGGLVVNKAEGVVDTPFQLEGMNGLGLSGVEIHGVIGYNLLARYRLAIDFTKDKMTWTALKNEPIKLERIGGKGGGTGGLEMVGTLMKMMGSMLGTKAEPVVLPRGFLGLELTDGGDAPTVKAVVGPAEKAGVKPGDKLTKFQGRTVTDSGDVLRFARKLGPGETVKLTLIRDKETMEITFKTGEGL
jgi:hypothetical protein